MQSPAELLEAAKPGEPYSEKEIAKIHNDYTKRFDCGFKGTHKLPEDYTTREARKVHTPPHWRRVGIEETRDSFRLVSLISRIEITQTDLDLIGLEDEPTSETRLQSIIEAGQRIEDAMQRLLPHRLGDKKQRLKKTR